MWLVIKPLLVGVVLPCLVCAAILTLAAWLFRHRDPSESLVRPSGVAVGAAYLAAHIALSGIPALVPVDATLWIVALVVAGVLAALLHDHERGSFLLSVIIGVVLAGLTSYLTLRSMIRYTWRMPEVLRWVAGIGIGLLLEWIILIRVCRRTTRPMGFIVLLLGSGGLAVILGLTGSALLGQRAGMLASAVGACWVGGWIGGYRASPAGTVPVMLAALGSLGISGFYYSYTPASALIVLAMVPIAVGLADLPTMRRVLGRGSALLPVVAAALITTLAIWVAFRSSAPTTPGY